MNNEMKSILEKLVANGFADFPGLKINGTLPVRQDLLNEIIAEQVQSWGAPKVIDKQEGGIIDVAQLLKRIKQLKVRAEGGIVTLDFEVEV